MSLSKEEFITLMRILEYYKNTATHEGNNTCGLGRDTKEYKLIQSITDKLIREYKRYWKKLIED